MQVPQDLLAASFDPLHAGQVHGPSALAVSVVAPPVGATSFAFLPQPFLAGAAPGRRDRQVEHALLEASLEAEQAGHVQPPPDAPADDGVATLKVEQRRKKGKGRSRTVRPTKTKRERITHYHHKAHTARPTIGSDVTR